MYVGEKLMDSVDVSTDACPQFQGKLIRVAMHGLLQNHLYDLTSSDLPPQFYLEGVPSQINGFQSLKDKYAHYKSQ